MDAVNLIGTLAGTFTTISYLPQVIKVWRTRHTADISVLMYCVLCTGVALWCVFGILIRSYPVIVSNGVSLVLALIVLGFKLRYG